MAFIEEEEEPTSPVSSKNSSSQSSEGDSFLANILKPGSSLNPTFLAILDAAFVSLFLIFVALAFLTNGNPHIFVLMVIEGCLWASVKWFVIEVKQARANEQTSEVETKKGQ